MEAGWTTALLITDRECGSEERARAAEVPVTRIGVGGRDAGVVSDELVAALRGADIEVIFLAGYLRLVPAAVVRGWKGRILNVHPALLPSFGGDGMWGLHVHRAVLASGARISGPTVHLVDEVYDEGRVIAQWPVAVRADDTPEALAARVLAVEHRLYPLAAASVCSALLSGASPDALQLSPGHFAPSDHPGP